MLFITNQIIPRFNSTAVASIAGFCPNPPSPTKLSTTLFGLANFAPIAAGGPNPIVANPPGVKIEPGVSMLNCCPTPFLFHPTSVVIIASSGSALLVSARILSGIIGNEFEVAILVFFSMNAFLNFAIFFRNFGLSKPPGYISFATRNKTVNADFASAITPISVG